MQERRDLHVKDQTFEFIRTHGPKTSPQLVAKFRVPKASMRRICSTLMKEGKIAPIPSGSARRTWGVSANLRDQEPPPPKKVKKPAPPPEPTPTEKWDWEATDFCF